MKAISIFVTAVSLVSATQLSHASALQHWGIQAGLASATLEWESDFISNDELSRKNGFAAGVFTEWFDYRGLSLFVGVNYEQRGAGHTINATDQTGRPLGEITMYSSTDYLSFPALAKFAIGAGTVRPYVLAGPRVDVFLGYATDSEHFSWGFEDDWNDVILGLTGGVGIEMRVMSSRVLFASFVYNYEPTWRWESTSELTGNVQRVKGNSFNLSIGIGL